MPEVSHPDRIEVTAAGRLLRFGSTLTGLALAVFLIVPRTSPFALLVMALPVLPLAFASSWQPAQLGRPPMAIALLLAVYLLLNSLWAQDRLEATGKALLFTAIVVVAWLSAHGLTQLPNSELDRIVRIGLIGFASVLAYLLFEEFTFHQIKRALFNWLPFTRPNEKHLQLDGGLVANIYLYVSNRSMAAVMLSLWPVLFLLLSGGVLAGGEARRWLAAAGVVGVTGVTFAMSQHETSDIALVLSLVTAGVALRWRGLAIGVVAAAWIVSTLLVIPIVSQAYTTYELHMAKWLPTTARQRIIIWGYTAEQVAKAPIFGIGIDSGKLLDARHDYVKPAGHVYPRRTGTHSHNVFVQTWYELGAIGALLLCAFGLSILVAIGRLPHQQQPFALATFVSAAVLAAFSWGMWQPWFMALFGVAAFLFLVARERVRRVEGAGVGGSVPGNP